MPVNILFIHSEYHLYGSSVSLLNLCATLDRRFYRPFVVLPENGPLANALEQHGIPVFIMKLGLVRRAPGLGNILNYLVRTASSTVQLVSLIQTHNIHAVHTNTILVHSGAIAARITGKKVIWHIRERITEPRAVMYYIFNLIRWMSHRIICISQNVKENMESFTGVLERAEVIYNGVDLSVFSPSPVSRDRGARLKKSFTIPDDHYVVGIVGRVAFWKGHDTFVKAAKRVLDQGHQVIFLVAGDLDREINQRYYDSLFSYIDQHHLSKNFIFTGFIADVAAVYAALDIAVVPSTRPEPFGLVAIEALAMGKPVIATNHGGTAEIIADTGFGALIPPGDHKALAANIISYINSESHMKRVKTLAPIYIKDNFAIGSCVNRIQLVYNKIHGINWK